MRVMEVCILELMIGRRWIRQYLLPYVWGRFDVKQLRMCHPLAVTRTTAGTTCAGDFVCVCPSGLPFGNTVKSYCLSSSHSASCSFQHSLFSSPSIPLSHIHPLKEGQISQLPHLHSFDSRILIILPLDGDLISHQIWCL